MFGCSLWNRSEEVSTGFSSETSFALSLSLRLFTNNSTVQWEDISATGQRIKISPSQSQGRQDSFSVQWSKGPRLFFSPKGGREILASQGNSRHHCVRYVGRQFYFSERCLSQICRFKLFDLAIRFESDLPRDLHPHQILGPKKKIHFDSIRFKFCPLPLHSPCPLPLSNFLCGKV